jgi:hypothetical protein
LRHFADVSIIQTTPSSDRCHEPAETLDKDMPSFARSGTSVHHNLSEIVLIGKLALRKTPATGLDHLIDRQQNPPISLPRIPSISCNKASAK